MNMICRFAQLNMMGGGVMFKYCDIKERVMGQILGPFGVCVGKGVHSGVAVTMSTKCCAFLVCSQLNKHTVLFSLSPHQENWLFFVFADRNFSRFLTYCCSVSMFSSLFWRENCSYEHICSYSLYYTFL